MGDLYSLNQGGYGALSNQLSFILFYYELNGQSSLTVKVL